MDRINPRNASARHSGLFWRNPNVCPAVKSSRRTEASRERIVALTYSLPNVLPRRSLPHQSTCSGACCLLKIVGLRSRLLAATSFAAFSLAPRRRCLWVSRNQRFEGRNREGRGKGMFRRLGSLFSRNRESWSEYSVRSQLFVI